MSDIVSREPFAKLASVEMFSVTITFMPSVISHLDDRLAVCSLGIFAIRNHCAIDRGPLTVVSSAGNR